MKVLITASYGHIGQVLIPKLHQEGVFIRTVDPNPAHVESLKNLGADEVLVGDFRQDAIIEQEVAGIDKILLILPDNLSGMVSMAERLICAAEKAHVTHFVFSSCLNTVSALLQHWEKYQIEDMLMGSKLNYTILKPSGYMEMHYPSGPDSIFSTGHFVTPITTDQIGNMISLKDIAAATTKVLLSQKEYYFTSLDLCGAENTTMQQQLEQICHATGHPLKVELVPTPHFPDNPHASEQIGRIVAYHSNHPYAGNSFDFEALMGRKPRTLQNYIDDVLANAH
ncbi:SDR family oxidoreductase [Levilactobacillus namurensis]|uniref:SDR family oxidoreductase n=1 Tax=Levilactobacillus namurensis TaxID=380393 RepID=UPI002231822D|nr:NmrA family NAD(P)-binding protein [Levilactobacillus namurensis]MCW3778901.1 NmrA family NAD(P)-binding protein [Levilactobacillus namurensis]MDT7017804.1 NmrA family NAD(P)-binding protein [Levilactobacillus namurensis]WNN65195.1 NmrA family NAD(P)-binding protein [Levilactobacillus namurensis]